MLDDLQHVPDQFTKALSFAKQFQIPKKWQINKVVIVGMGGSGFPGNLVKDYLEFENIKTKRITPNCIQVWEDYNLPPNTNKNTLVITMSHSGNTEETVSAANLALKKRYPLVIISQGGKLQKIAHKNKTPYIQLPDEGIQPRLATGYMTSAILIVLQKAGLIPNQTATLTAISKFIKRAFSQKNKSFKLAPKLKKHLPIIYSDNQYQNLARIFKIKFNENSKYPAFWNFLSELNHNEMIGWTTTPVQPHFFFLIDPKSSRSIKKRFKILKKLLKAKGYPITELKLQGKNYLQKVFHTLIIADFITIKFAQIRKIDPEPVPMVEEFKKLL